MGLIGGMVRTAVVAGTATAVSNRVSRRHAARWSGDDRKMLAPQAPGRHASPQPPEYPLGSPTPPPDDEVIELLRGLGELRAGGVLTEEEFAEQKARLLAR